MAKPWLLGLLGLLALLLGGEMAWGAEPAAPPELQSQAAILIEARTGQVLAEKESRRRMEPASLTKIMTCLMAMEQAGPEERVVVTAEALQLMADASAIGLRERESLTMAEMLYAAMLPSANDAAAAVGIHLAGSSPAFAEEMAKRAEELGLTDTRFVNAHGLPAPGHYTTAYDLARITRAALDYPEFLQYAGAQRYLIPASQYNRSYGFSHLHRGLLPGSSYYDPRIIAGKTGWTGSAGSCLMTVAEQDGVRLIVIVLKADQGEVTGAAYADTKALLDYGFTAYRREELPLPSQGILATLEEGSEWQYYLTPEKETMAVMLPRELPSQGHSLAVTGLAEGSGRDAFRGRVEVRDRTGKTLLEAGEVPLQGEPMTVEPLGPAAVVYLPMQEAEPELWQLAAASAFCAVLFLAAKRLYHRPPRGMLRKDRSFLWSFGSLHDIIGHQIISKGEGNEDAGDL